MTDASCMYGRVFERTVALHSLTLSTGLSSQGLMKAEEKFCVGRRQTEATLLAIGHFTNQMVNSTRREEDKKKKK